MDGSFDLISSYDSSELIILGDMNINWLANVADNLKNACIEFNLM